MTEIVIWDAMGQMGKRNSINRTGLVFTIHEWQMGTDDIIHNEHEWYLPFTLGDYFINEIILLHLIQIEITQLNLV
jgi:hypothetical protein